MRKMNFSLRLQPSLMEEARRAAASEGVSLNQLINVAVAEKVSALRTEIYLHERIRRADHEETLRILDRAVKGNPPMEGDELLIGGLQVQPAPAIGPLPVLIAAVTRGVKVQAVPPPDLEQAGEAGNPTGRATPQFGKLKRQLEKARGR
jgi:HicB-like protein involved in pilus formation